MTGSGVTLRRARKARLGSKYPTSIRLSASLYSALRSEAERTRRPLSWVITELLEIALRTQRFPGVVFLADTLGHRVCVAGTGLEIWEIIDLLEQHGSAAALSGQHPHLSLEAIHTAEAYARAYGEEVLATREMHRRIQNGTL